MAAQGDHVDTAKILLFHKAIIDDVTMVCSRSVCMQLNNIQPVIMKRPCVAVNRFPSHSYGVLHAIWDNTVKGKGKGQYSSSWGDLHLRVMQCYLPSNTSEHTLPYPQLDRLVLNLPIPEGWKAELT